MVINRPTKQVNQAGNASPLPRANGGWAQEISLDVDMASAVCPNCKILLVEANSNAFTDLAPGDVGGEKTFTLEGVNLLALAISGDGKELLLAHMFQEDAVPKEFRDVLSRLPAHSSVKRQVPQTAW